MRTKLSDHDRQFSWHDYNKSQTKEKALLVNLLKDLCDLIDERITRVSEENLVRQKI